MPRNKNRLFPFQGGTPHPLNAFAGIAFCAALRSRKLNCFGRQFFATQAFCVALGSRRLNCFVCQFFATQAFCAALRSHRLNLFYG